jgi:hypothetical protein
MLEPDSYDNSKVSVVNLYSGYYRITAIAYISSQNSNERRPQGVYKAVIDNIFIAPEINVNLQMLLDYQNDNTNTGDTAEVDTTENGG